MAIIIDGKKIAAELRASLAPQVATLTTHHGRAPHLAIVLVGDHEPSKIYVRNKRAAAAKIGIATTLHHLPATLAEADLLALIAGLNENAAVDGILVQLPLPASIDTHKVFNLLNPLKDVDGLTPTSAGLLMAGTPRFVPCTPAGCLKLIHSVRADLSGLHAVVVGRSAIVGKPMAQVLLQQNCTVTITHSQTQDLASHTRSADILVAAIGRANFIGAAHIKPGAIVIDVGINRTAAGLVGDVDFAAALPLASAITPVPGGVGPFTIACLLQNTVYAANHQR